MLARIEPSDRPLAAIDNDMTDGLVLLVVITGSHHAASWRASGAIADPTITRVLVATDGDATGVRLGVSARSEDEFVAAWQAMVGHPVAARHTVDAPMTQPEPV